MYLIIDSPCRRYIIVLARVGIALSGRLIVLSMSLSRVIEK